MPKKVFPRTTTSSRSQAEPRGRKGQVRPRKEPSRQERVQKVLARAGLGSRREIETWIKDGRIEVNGRTVVPGDCIGPGDQVRLDGREITSIANASTPPRVVMYYKAAGEICSRRDPQGRPTAFDRLPKLDSGRWVSVGRLDLNSSGLLLFTNDGELANALMHPSTRIEREYAVRVRALATRAQISRLLAGVELEDGPGRFQTISDGGGEGTNHWYRCVITEGRKREVRRLWASQGLTVSRLIRIRYGPAVLPRSMRSGRVRELAPDEVAALRRAATSNRRRV